jgi:phage shock protein PspC (stress-responsive transcriptional regulator)
MAGSATLVAHPSVTPQLAAMIAFTVFGVIFFIIVWVVMLRAQRKDEPPRQ